MQGHDMANCHSNRAVTLIEMLVVLGIIVVLASLVITLTLRVDNQSKERALDNAFALLGTSLREYYEVKGGFPEQTERDSANALAHIEAMVAGLRSVPDARHVLDQLNPAMFKSQAGLADVPELRDPWGTVLDYVYDPDPDAGDTFPELISAGPDKRFGTGDDMSSKSRNKN
jgi:prepilin-type N-terminal cleavage/methylation domain-containing protein